MQGWIGGEKLGSELGYRVQTEPRKRIFADRCPDLVEPYFENNIVEEKEHSARLATRRFNVV